MAGATRHIRQEGFAAAFAADLVRDGEPAVDPNPFRLARFHDGSPLFIDPDVI